jgi:hypothetical protein
MPDLISGKQRRACFPSATLEQGSRPGANAFTSAAYINNAITKRISTGSECRHRITFLYRQRWILPPVFG